MNKVLLSVVTVGLLSPLVALPSFGQQASETTRFSQSISQTQYGPFVEAGSASQSAQLDSPVPRQTWQSQQPASTSIAFKPFGTYGRQPSTFVQPVQASVQQQQVKQDPELSPSLQTHQLGGLWQAVEPKRQGTDSPWADSK